MNYSAIGKDSHTLHGVVQVIPKNFSFVLSRIYAGTEYKRRKFTWDKLKDMSEDIDMP